MSVQILTRVPTAVSGLNDGTAYRFQNRSRDVAFIERATVAPTDTSGAFELRPGQWMTLQKTNATEIYAAALSKGAAEKPAPSIIYDEANRSS